MVLYIIVPFCMARILGLLDLVTVDPFRNSLKDVRDVIPKILEDSLFLS